MCVCRYHRINKRAKQKEYVKQFEMLMKTNPTEALDQLKKIEMSRMKVCRALEKPERTN